MNQADRLLHSANILVSTIGAVTAESWLPGSSAVLGGSLSVTSLFGAARPKTPDIDKRVSKALAAALANPAIHMPKEADKLIPQMIEAGALTSADVMAAARDPERICAAMLAKQERSEYRSYEIQQAFTGIVVPIFAELLKDREICDQLRPAFEQALAGSLAHIQQNVEHLKEQGNETARKLGVQEGLLIALAGRYGEGNPEDFESALAGLEHALQTAAEERDRGRLPGNVADAVDVVLAQVDALNDEGKIDAAAAALIDEIERHEAAQARLLDKGIAQAVLTRDVALAVRMELKRLALDGGEFKGLRRVQDVWYQRGRDKGLRFDLEVAIALAHEAARRALGPDQSSAALNDLGNALQNLGERESGTDRLRDAVAAHRNALKERTRARVPPDWAVTQNNLGNALLSLAEREGGTDRLHEAIAAYREVLKEFTYELDSGYWARTQSNLGNALLMLAIREESTDRLHAAISTYLKALVALTRKQDILHRARTLFHMGNALRILGALKSNSQWLNKAVAAYTEALEVWTRERMPLDQARAQGSLCSIELMFFDRTNLADHLDRAQVYLDAAREVFEEVEASRLLEMAAAQQAEIDRRRGVTG